MQLDKYYTISDSKAVEMASMTKGKLYKALWDMPIHTGISVSIREKKINELVDGLKEVHKAKKRLDKNVKELHHDIKQLKPKPSKSKPPADTRPDPAYHTDRPDNKEGED